MRIAVVQIKPVAGDIPGNLNRHIRLIDLAAPCGAEYLLFPELSVTGYEPQLAKDLATTPEDPRFDVFQNISDTRHVTLGIGVPMRTPAGICISMVLFQPHQSRQWYSKQSLHSDEEPFFVPGQGSTGFLGEDPRAALAICYELSVPEHAANASHKGATIYLASVAKTAGGIEKALPRLAEIAREYSMTVLMSNCVGQSDGCEWGGKTSVWNNKGALLAQLDEVSEGFIVFDTETQEVMQRIMESNES